MSYQQTGQIAGFIWRIADDVLRDVFVRGKYRDVILPMTVIRRLDAVLEPTKSAVLERLEWARENNIPDPDMLLKGVSGHPFYNVSNFTLKSLLNSPKQLQANFVEYLDGFSPNVREILEQFEFRNQIPKLAKEDRIGLLIQRFTDPDINLSPHPTATRPGLDNHAMGTIFEELIRRFNEENNEEAGEHFTPRDVVTLMADLILLPVAEQIESGTYSIYDGACGTGGMLTVAEERLQQIAQAHGKSIEVHLYGQEVNGETWAISKADQLIKGDDAEHIAHDSTLAADAFPTRSFDFMLSNPPYGKSWSADLERLGGKGNMRDPRFVIDFAGDPEYSLVTRSSDGQMMFLANKLSKMMKSEQGSRIAEVHNGSSLFTGDAGQGESNIRRWIIESDWLEAIIALPTNMFYNTGIATYIWVISNRKPTHRQGKVQLIDATKRFTPLRKNLGQKNAELREADIQSIIQEFLAFEESETSKIFPNEAFGYRKVIVDRPLRFKINLTRENVEALRESGRDDDLADAMENLLNEAGSDARRLSYSNVPISLNIKGRWNAKRDKLYREFFCERDEDGEPVTKTYLDERLTNEDGRESWDPKDIPMDRRLSGIGIWCPPVPFRATAENPFPGLATFEPDPDLRDTEQIPLTESVKEFMKREVWPYAPDAWVAEGSEKIGYEISFTRYFCKPQQLRTLAEIEADILALEKETDGLLEEILVEVR